MSAAALLLIPALAAAGGETADVAAETAVRFGPATTGLPRDTVHDGRPGSFSDLTAAVVPSPAAPGTEAVARPIRANEPGTGVFIGSGLLLRTLFDRESSGTAELETWTAVAEVRHTPSTHWVVGARVPFVLNRELERPDAAVLSRTGLGDASVAVKHRFFREVGRWSDRHMAAEVKVKLPTGISDPARPAAAAGLPAEVRRRLPPGTGSVDFVADLIYQEGRRRFVYGGDLALRLNTAGEDGYRVGHEVRLNLDLEYIVFPLEYRRPGDEVFVLLESTLRRKWTDRVGGRSRPTTSRTDLLAAPAVQHIVSEQLLASVSVQLPVVSDAGPSPGGAPETTGFEQELNLLVEVRYAF